jgi:cysteine desulfurase
MNNIYADHNATTPLCREATEKMHKAMEIWGNPSSAHRPGRLANQLLNDSRESVAQAAGVEPLEVVFTSGGSEANTLALLGSFWSSTERPFRLLTSRVEHSSVRDTVAFLQSQKAEIQFITVERPNGELCWNEFITQLADFKPHLVSLMAANNETGVCFPIDQISNLAKEHQFLLHTDAVQAFGKTPPSVWNRADFVSLSAHKIHGPKGSGALIIRSGKKLVPTHFGGAQEIKRRGGTENLIGIAGFGAACTVIPQESTFAEMARVRDHFEKVLLDRLPQVFIHGGKSPRIPNTSNIRFEGIASEVLLGALDMDGVSVSAGSACSSGSISPSHVLLELGLEPNLAKQCLRFSWGRTTSQAEVDTVAELVINHVQRIRSRRAST